MEIIAALIAPVPIFHFWLHGLLGLWRRYPYLLYIWGLVLWLFSILVFTQAIPSDRLWIESTVLKIFGWSLISLGLLAALWSIKTLGFKRFFVWGVLHPKSVPAIRERSGPFKFFPHPAYGGYLVIAVGLVLVSGQTFAVGFLAYLLIVTPMAIWLEEKELLARLGN